MPTWLRWNGFAWRSDLQRALLRTRFPRVASLRIDRLNHYLISKRLTGQCENWHAPASALFCGRRTAWLLAASGRREAPPPASGPIDSLHDESWAADRSRRRFATLDDLMDPKPSRRVCVDPQNRQEWHARSTRCSADASARRPVTPGGWVEIQNPKSKI